MMMVTILVLLVFAILDFGPFCSANGGQFFLHQGWMMCPVGRDLSFSSTICVNATIPGTVLTTLLKHKSFGFDEAVLFDFNFTYCAENYCLYKII